MVNIGADCSGEPGWVFLEGASDVCLRWLIVQVDDLFPLVQFGLSAPLGLARPPKSLIAPRRV